MLDRGGFTGTDFILLTVETEGNDDRQILIICKTHSFLQNQMLIQALNGTAAAHLSLFPQSSTIMQIRFVFDLQFLMWPTHWTKTNLTPVCFAFLFALFSVFLCQRALAQLNLCHPNDCMVAIAAQLWNQGHRRVQNHYFVADTRWVACFR